ncbi:MAG TPA: ribosome-associated translation inhibitor RaiA [Candidatus Limnocylindrales bacterium]|nr:ribosome-associated translation inhibitor RaiA [Candidatus Limnocylindrales bacterium]
MRTTIRGKNLTVAEKDSAYIERKLRRLERMLDERSEADVELRLEGNRKVADSHIVEVALSIDGRSLRGNAAAATFRAATDDVIDKLERRTAEHKQRPRDRRRAEQVRFNEASVQLGSGEGPEAEGDGSLVVKIKRFAIEPMFEEDAISRMEELGHTFFIFVNAENERIAVLYRRRDGRYGLIEPVIGGTYGRDV